MNTYYDELGLPPQAGAVELEAALDARYNQYRNLVTHPDATVVEEANRNLRLLEQMRATLTDANRRAAYDAGIGVGGAGGLADPAAILRKAAPPPPPRATTPTQAGAPADLWVCPNCSTPNPEWTPFCLKCRTPLLRKCPECGQMKSLVKTGVCGNCGYEYTTAEKRAALRKEVQGLNEQLKVAQGQRGALAEQLAAADKAQKGSGSALMWTILLFGLPGGLCLLSSCAAIAQGDGEGGMIVFVLAVPFLVIAGLRLNSASKKKETAQQETTRLQQQIATLNAESSGLQNELQARQAALERLGH